MNEEDDVLPQQVLRELEDKMTQLAHEYASGEINASQYNAIYRYYSEKRVLIEHIVDTNPDNPTWRTVAQTNDTSLLKEQFLARLQYYAVFRRDNETPLLTEGKIPRSVAEQLLKLLQTMWRTDAWRRGVARKSLGAGRWLVLCMGDQGMTLGVFHLPPSKNQLNRLRDVHDDFEEANHSLLRKDNSTERLVFPQRSLLEK